AWAVGITDQGSLSLPKQPGVALPTLCPKAPSCLLLFPHGSSPAHFSVIGPNHAITASVGDEVTLACHLSPSMSAENMEVRWYRAQFSSVVHLYREGKDQYTEQMSEYRQRTEFLKDGLADGRVALRIGNIRLSDSGLYMCFFRSEFSYQEAALELQVSGSKVLYDLFLSAVIFLYIILYM
uniref:Ig-like domain-containing protein n=1 Tax=Chrysemys picta bellii TaxID=8478 RepID=A0A8C3I9T8_CHRPI